jgi:hypothetical protein
MNTKKSFQYYSNRIIIGGGTGGRGLSIQEGIILTIRKEMITVVNVAQQLIVHNIPQK